MIKRALPKRGTTMIVSTCGPRRSIRTVAVCVRRCDVGIYDEVTFGVYLGPRLRIGSIIGYEDLGWIWWSGAYLGRTLTRSLGFYPNRPAVVRGLVEYYLGDERRRHAERRRARR